MRSKPYIPPGAPLFCRLLHREFAAVIVNGITVEQYADSLIGDRPQQHVAYWVCRKCDRMVMVNGD